MVIWAGLRSPARCRMCRQPIVFVTNQRGRQVPMNPGLFVYGRHQDAEGRYFEHVDDSERHTCKPRTKR